MFCRCHSNYVSNNYVNDIMNKVNTGLCKVISWSDNNSFQIFFL